jgi:hypothetical protein
MIRLTVWTVFGAYAVVLLAGKGSISPLSVTTSGAMFGGGLGLTLGMLFSQRAMRHDRGRSRMSHDARKT